MGRHNLHSTPPCLSLLSRYLPSLVLNSAQFSGEKKLFEMGIILVGEELTCRKHVVHFVLHYSTKTLSRKLRV